jgi:hypothetical protein
MYKFTFSSGTFVLATLLMLGSSVTFAESARNANIWDWRNHEPVPSEVQKKERAARILPTPQQQQAKDREVESIYRSLLNATYFNRSQSTKATV